MLFVWGLGAVFTIGWMLADRARKARLDCLDVYIAVVIGFLFWPFVLGYDCSEILKNKEGAAPNAQEDH